MSLSEYDIISVLGEGATSYVYKIQHKKTGATFALKKVGKQDENYFTNEINILKTLDNPHILKIENSFSQDDKLYIVLELCKENLVDTFEKLEVGSVMRFYAAKRYMTNILEAIAYMHEKGVTHRDIKQENILLCNGVPKISDFGSSLLQKTSSELRGTLDFVAPEVWDAFYDSKKVYNQKIDIWSFGVMMHECFSGEMPFEVESGDSNRVVRNFKYKLSPLLPDEVKTILEKIFVPAAKRPSAKQLLRYNFFKKDEVNLKRFSDEDLLQFCNEMGAKEVKETSREKLEDVCFYTYLKNKSQKLEKN